MYGLLLQPNSADSKSITATSATATGAGAALSTSNCRQAYWQGEGIGTITGGTAVYETNMIAVDYAGTWEVRETLTLSTLSGGAVSSQGTYPGGFFGRWRLTAPLTGPGSFIGHHNALAQ